MRIWIPAIAALLALAMTPIASAKTPIDRWAARHDMKGAWKTKDADRDGVKNRQEFALKTNPRKADSDRDGVKDGDELSVGMAPLRADTDRDGVRDGDENAGVITAYEDSELTIRRFHGGPITVAVDTDSLCAGSDEAAFDEEDELSEGFVEVTEDAATGDPHWAEDESVEEQEEVVDVGGDDDYGYSGCDDPRLKPGALVTSAVIEDGLATEINVKS